MCWEFINQASRSPLHWASYLCHAWAKIIDHLLLVFPFYRCIQSQQLIVFLDFSISIFNHLHNLDDTSVYVRETTCMHISFCRVLLLMCVCDSCGMCGYIIHIMPKFREHTIWMMTHGTKNWRGKGNVWRNACVTYVDGLIRYQFAQHFLSLLGGTSACGLRALYIVTWFYGSWGYVVNFASHFRLECQLQIYFLLTNSTSTIFISKMRGWRETKRWYMWYLPTDYGRGDWTPWLVCRERGLWVVVLMKHCIWDSSNCWKPNKSIGLHGLYELRC
jgi:hypothetical protein